MRLPAWIVAVVLVALWTGPALAGETSYTNAKGQYVGKKDDAGRIIDAKGQVRGKEDEKGRIYNQKGRYQGINPNTAKRKTITSSLRAN